jgi:hypothetical protein
MGDWAVCPFSNLLADTQAANQLRIALGILHFQVVEQPAALTDQLEQAAARMMIFRVRLEVFGEIADAFAENGDLNFRRAGVGFVSAVRSDELGLPVFIQCHECLPPRATQKTVPATMYPVSPVRRNVLVPNE